MEEQMIFDNAKLSRLYRKVLTTAKCKHNASTRIKSHHLLSQWTLALISSVLIITPLIESGHDFGKSYSYIQYFSAIQVGFAVLVLVSSILVGALSFSLRVERFHQCGIELDKLSYRISNEQENHKYYDLYTRYVSVLDKYENHKSIDHIKAKRSMVSIYYKETATQPQFSKNISYARDAVKYYWLIFFEYLPYMVVPLLLVTMGYVTYLEHLA